MTSKIYIVDRVLHWVSAFLLLFMLMNLSSQLHHANWDIKGQLLHRQDAVEIHAIMGIILVVLTIGRIVYSHLSKPRLNRVQPKSIWHQRFIQITHVALYICIFSLVATGIAMINHYEIPLTIYGIEFSPDKEGFYDTFPSIHSIHLQLREAIWWLIAIHFVGIMYAKR
ncbi:cytochrome b/b6 domain-containing protein [Planctobacterium marinum]|uniref:Cytochrome b561 bacterial/Ni-hydrogenase domain-containing protein n=1 Tax=Planctobacterium marinum TaxID=1631968 RepID=A0AA48HIR5_9ALTE|nr:hypothetical protein MACH26_15600 [Planctobacterium marinum]